MSSLNLAPDELKTLEFSRNRVAQLKTSIESLLGQLAPTDGVGRPRPLPSPQSLQATALILQKNLESLQKVMMESNAFFQRVVVHPSTNYPTGVHSHNQLEQLLRKKLTPDLEVWADASIAVAQEAGVDPKRLGLGAGGKDGDDEDEEEQGYKPMEEDPLSELWADVKHACENRIQSYLANEAKDSYTTAERALGVESVRTGLRWNWDEEEEEEEEGDEEATEEAGPDVIVMADGEGGVGIGGQGQREPPERLQPEHALWCALRGDLEVPKHIMFDEVRKARDAAKK